MTVSMRVSRPFRRLPRRIGGLTCAVILGALVSPIGVSPISAQDPAPDPSVRALEVALDRRMTIWRTPVRTIHVRHCRTAAEGCEGRLRTFARMIGDASATHELDPFLLAAVAMRESGLDPSAAGQAGERGIVQLHPRGSGGRVRYVQSEAYRRNCERRPGACQEEVLDVGARLLARSIERCGSVRDGLGAYNRGECGVTDYSRLVMSERQRLLRLVKQPEAEAN
jgi:hypothetical protein